MTGYTIVNLKEVEDQAPKFGYSPNLEARFARVPLELENSGISYFRVAPNFRIPFGHKHRQQEEIYVLVLGSARMKLDHLVVELKPWDAIRVPAETMRGLEAGPDGAEYIAFGAPNTENRDAELTPNWWTTSIWKILLLSGPYHALVRIGPTLLRLPIGSWGLEATYTLGAFVV